MKANKIKTLVLTGALLLTSTGGSYGQRYQTEVPAAVPANESYCKECDRVGLGRFSPEIDACFHTAEACLDESLAEFDTCFISARREFLDRCHEVLKLRLGLCAVRMDICLIRAKK